MSSKNCGGRTRALVKPKAFIFDLDGVLTDTAELHYLGWKRLADELGIGFNRNDNEALRGISRRASLLLLLKGCAQEYTDAQLDEFMERKNSYYRQYIESITPADLLPGSLELLERLKQQGYQLALGSASKNAPAVIKKLGLASYFSVVADPGSVKNAKPAPDLFLLAARELGVEPSSCVVVEDASAGVEAALEAGMWVIGIGPASRVGAADYVYDSLVGINPERLFQEVK